jgi:hypothetical protein
LTKGFHHAPAIGKHEFSLSPSIQFAHSVRRNFGAKVRRCSKPHYLISQSAAHSLNILSHQPTNKQTHAFAVLEKSAAPSDFFGLPSARLNVNIYAASVVHTNHCNYAVHGRIVSN